MICAVIDISTSEIVNLIIADCDKDIPHAGTLLIPVPHGVEARPGCVWTPENGFVCPPLPEQPPVIDGQYYQSSK